jgi:CheY-like chemotaxis protein
VEDGDAVPGLSVKTGDYVRISIQDRGIGISEENLDKLFDPYFSTKPMGTQKGMGLGLATAHAIIKKHGGDITIQSTPDMGTTVSMYLPAHPSNDAAENGTPASLKTQFTIADQKAPRQRILLMDDEEMLRNLAKQMLSRLGYEVETVKDGVEAIEVYRKQFGLDKPFDAVILDLTIKGGMGGEQTLKELLKIDPEIKAVVSSGYFNDPVMADFQDYGFKGAMAKPYELKDLKEVLEKVLSMKN